MAQVVTNIAAFNLATLHDTTTIAAEKTRVIQRVFGLHSTYARLTAAQKDAVEYALDEAAMFVTEMGRWFADVDPALSADSTHELGKEWTPLLLSEWVYRLFQETGSYENAAEYHKSTNELNRNRIVQHFSKNWYDSSVLEGDYTIRSMRYSILLNLVRRKNPVFPPALEVDRAIIKTFRQLWKMRNWMFTVRPVWFTVNTDGSLNVDSGTNLEFDGLVGRYLILKDDNVVYKVLQANATQMTEFLGVYVDTTSGLETGVPRVFYPYKEGDDWVFQFVPQADKAYNGFGVFKIQAPDLLNVTDTLDDLPNEFQEALLFMTLARLTDDAKDQQKADNAITLLPSMDEDGHGDFHFAQMDQSRQISGAGSYRGGAMIGGTGLGG